MGCIKLTYSESLRILKVVSNNLKISVKSYAGDYRYGYQGQETDDEVKGEGNSVNYKYRMHDARIGRFFAVDPLAPQYPHNSPYAFSENRVIDGIELEGLEYYYTASGELLGKFGKSDEIRITTTNSYELFKELDDSYVLSMNHYSQPLSSFANGDKDERQVLSNVATSIYENVQSGKKPLADGHVKVVNSQSLSLTVGPFNSKTLLFLMRQANPNLINPLGYSAITFKNNNDGIAVNGFNISTNYWDLSMTLYHESLHWNDEAEGGAWGEFKAHWKVSQHEDYKNTSEGYQSKNMQSLYGYLNDQYNLLQKMDTESNSYKKKLKEYESNLSKYNELQKD